MLITFGVATILLTLISFHFLFSADASNHSTIENASRDSIQNAINMGAVRVTEEITIDEEIAKEAFIRQYVESSNFNDGTRVLNVADVQSQPASLAVESYNVIDDWPIFKWLNINKEAKTREMDFLIYEAKNTQDTRGGDVK